MTEDLRGNLRGNTGNACTSTYNLGAPSSGFCPRRQSQSPGSRSGVGAKGNSFEIGEGGSPICRRSGKSYRQSCERTRTRPPAILAVALVTAAAAAIPADVTGASWEMRAFWEAPSRSILLLASPRTDSGESRHARHDRRRRSRWRIWVGGLSPGWLSRRE